VTSKESSNLIDIKLLAACRKKCKNRNTLDVSAHESKTTLNSANWNLSNFLF